MGQNIIGDMKFDNLLAGVFPRSVEAVTLAAGAVYPVGAVVGMATDGGLCSLVDSSKSDGTEMIYGVLLSPVDATLGQRQGVVSLTGEFNRNGLTFGGTDTWDKHYHAARKQCLFFKAPAIGPNF